VAVQRLVQDALPLCHAHKRVAFEDLMVALCFEDVMNITATETDTRRVECSGRPTIGTRRLATLYGLRVAILATSKPSQHSMVGPKQELEAVATVSISFHHLYNPQYVVARFHSILHPRTCPATSPLGNGLRQQQRIV
jgi:hypothetical protein